MVSTLLVPSTKQPYHHKKFRLQSNIRNQRESATMSIQNGHDPLSTQCKRGGWPSFPFIIGSLMGFALTASGWLTNLIVCLITEFNIKSITATQINNVVNGCISLFPIAGAIIADSFFSSFSVISVSAFVSLLGVILLTLASTIHSLRPPSCSVGSDACEGPSVLQYAVLYLALALASLGPGGTRFTTATMGADQFDNSNDQAKFFSWYFFTVYLSIAISSTAIVYIQDSVSWGLGFGICVIANAIGLAVFMLGKRFYLHNKPKGSPFMSIARVLVAAFRKRRISETSQTDWQVYHHEDSTTTACPTESFRCLNGAALEVEGDRLPDGSYAKSWRVCSVEEVEDLKSLIKIMPLCSTGILLSTSIAMMNSLRILQALNMDRHLGPHFQIPAGSFLVFTLIASVVSIFIIDQFLIPMWKNLTHGSFTPLQRIGIGHIINIFALILSALIESKRLQVVKTHHLQGKPHSVPPISGMWLVLPLATLGIGEGFHVPGQVALFYQEFPKSLRSTSTAMMSLLTAIGYYLSTAITGLIRRSTEWLPDNINDGRVDCVFWTFAVIGGLNFGYYLTCAKLFRYQNVQSHVDKADPDP